MSGISIIDKPLANLVFKKEFDSNPFFAELPRILLDEIEDIIQVIRYEPGEEILKQGDMNRSLYFLVIGTIDVYVDGGLVASLSKKGDLLGEMSVITNKPCSATIKTKTPVDVFSIDADELKRASKQTDEYIEHVLYRLYAHILTDKVHATNQKAKYFEDLSSGLKVAQEELRSANEHLEQKVADRTKELEIKTRDLQESNLRLEQKNTEMLASHKKLEELYQTRDITFSKLDELYENSLQPFYFKMKELHVQLVGEQREDIALGMRHAKDLMVLVKPLVESFQSEKSIQSKRVLLLEPVKKQQTIAKMALGGTGVDLKIVATLEEAKDALLDGGADILLLSSDCSEMLGFIKNNYPGIKTVLMSSEKMTELIDHLRGLDFTPNIVSRDDEDRTFTIKNIMTTVTKLASSNIFGLEKYLSWGVETQEVFVQRSDQRSQLNEEMVAFFKSYGVRSSILSQVSIVVEEMLMNAIYDAPVDEEGNSLFNHMNRKELIELKEEQYSKLRYALDGTLLAVSVMDPFGSLSGKVILNYLESCYEDRAGQLNEEKGGAGRGLHQIIENSDLVVFNVHPGNQTEVICLFNIVPGVTGSMESSFHFFSV